MHDFRYVTKKQAQPIKDELYQILYMVQDLVRDNLASHRLAVQAVT